MQCNCPVSGYGTSRRAATPAPGIPIKPCVIISEEKSGSTRRLHTDTLTMPYVLPSSPVSSGSTCRQSSPHILSFAKPFQQSRLCLCRSGDTTQHHILSGERVIYIEQSYALVRCKLLFQTVSELRQPLQGWYGHPLPKRQQKAGLTEIKEKREDNFFHWSKGFGGYY